MSNTSNPEFVIYRGWRTARGSAALWSTERRERYLLRKDVAVPISLDRSVLAEATTESTDVFEMVATAIQTAGSSDAVSRLRGSELYGDSVPRAPQWRASAMMFLTKWAQADL